MILLRLVGKFLLGIPLTMIYSTTVLFHNYFSSSGEQPEHRLLACEQNNQMSVV